MLKIVTVFSLSLLVYSPLVFSQVDTPSCQKSVSAQLLKTYFKGEDYHVIRQECKSADGYRDVVAIRKFRFNQMSYFLTVAAATLETQIVPWSCLTTCLDVMDLSDSLYNRTLKAATSAPFLLSDDGVKHEFNQRQSLYLTADLCPSHHPIDQQLFEKIQGGVKPVPIALSVSGKWLHNHQTDLRYVLRMEEKGLLKITWVNHTYNHPYDKRLPNDKNFVLMKGVNLENEVLENEKLMLQNGLLPSVFFRFPGLISNAADIAELRQWGLIPLAADAWLALGQKPKMGSIILIHANGNEPIGLKDLYLDMEKWPKMRRLFDDLHNAFLN